MLYRVYLDRAEAGKTLARSLARFAAEVPVVLGLARGGVAVAFEIALALKAPLAALVVRKIGAPWQAELAMGAIADLGEMVAVFNSEILSELGLAEGDLSADIQRESLELARRTTIFNEVCPVPDVAGRTVIVVDDGIATGATARASLRALRKKGARKLILAVPVAAEDSIEPLKREADEIVCPMIEAGFGAVGAYYRRFDQLTDADVVELLRRAKDQDFLKATRAIS